MQHPCQRAPPLRHICIQGIGQSDVATAVWTTGDRLTRGSSYYSIPTFFAPSISLTTIMSKLDDLKKQNADLQGELNFDPFSPLRASCTGLLWLRTTNTLSLSSDETMLVSG